MLDFKGGASIDISEHFRILELHDGYYISGQSMLITVTDDAEACRISADMPAAV